MLAALRLVLFDDGHLLKSVALTPLATWVVIGGAVSGVLRIPFDLMAFVRLCARGAADPGPPHDPWPPLPPPRD